LTRSVGVEEVSSGERDGIDYLTAGLYVKEFQIALKTNTTAFNCECHALCIQMGNISRKGEGV
jgi:hypothetical protein